MSDLRESGAIEQDADMVMFLYREKYYMKDGERQQGEIPSQYSSISSHNNTNSNDEVETVEVIIGKHRSGPTGTIKLGFRASYQQFVNIATSDEEKRYGN